MLKGVYESAVLKGVYASAVVKGVHTSRVKAWQCHCLTRSRTAELQAKNPQLGTSEAVVCECEPMTQIVADTRYARALVVGGVRTRRTSHRHHRRRRPSEFQHHTPRTHHPVEYLPVVVLRGLKSGQHASVWSPNEDFGTSKNMLVRPFVSTFHAPKYSIWAKSDEKCLQNVVPTYCSTFQKSSFGEHRFWNADQTFGNVFSKQFIN